MAEQHDHMWNLLSTVGEKVGLVDDDAERNQVETVLDSGRSRLEKSERHHDEGNYKASHSALASAATSVATAAEWCGGVWLDQFSGIGDHVTPKQIADDLVRSYHYENFN